MAGRLCGRQKLKIFVELTEDWGKESRERDGTGRVWRARQGNEQSGSCWSCEGLYLKSNGFILRAIEIVEDPDCIYISKPSCLH